MEFKLKRKCEPKNFVPFFLQTILGLPLGDPDKVRDNSIGKGNIPTFLVKNIPEEFIMLNGNRA